MQKKNLEDLEILEKIAAVEMPKIAVETHLKLHRTKGKRHTFDTYYNVGVRRSTGTW